MLTLVVLTYAGCWSRQVDVVRGCFVKFKDIIPYLKGDKIDDFDTILNKYVYTNERCINGTRSK